MDVYSELNKAQLENLASDITPGTKGRIYHKSTTEPIKIDDGTTIHKVLTDQMYPSIRTGVLYDIEASNLAGGFALPNTKITPNYGVSAASGYFNHSGFTTVNVPNLSVGVTLSGTKPVEIGLVFGKIGIDHPSDFFNASGSIYILRDGVVISQQFINFGLTASSVSGGTKKVYLSIPPSCVRIIDETPATGLSTYKIQASGSGSSIIFEDVKLFVREF